MQETLYQTSNAGDTLSDSGCRSLPIRQRMEETFYQTADARVYQTADAGDTLSDIGCRSLSIRQQMQKSLFQTADVGVSL